MSEQGVLRLSLPPGWRPLRGWFLLIVAVAVLNVAVYAGLTRPRWYNVTAQSRALEAARQARQLLEPALAEARANYGLVLQAETDLDELHNRISASATSVSSVIESLEEKLRAVGMRQERSNYARERIDELDLVLLQIAVPLSGRYSAVRQLVELLAAGTGFMAIDQVGLASPDQSGSGGSLQVELQLVAFLPASAPSLPSSSRDDSLPIEETGAEAGISARSESDLTTGEVEPALNPAEESADNGELRGVEAGELPAVETDEQPGPEPDGITGSEAPPQSEQEIAADPPRERAPAMSNVSPVQRAAELQARLASLPPLPFPPEAYDLRLDDLDVSRAVSGTQGRNLFDFVRPPQARPAPVQPTPGPRPKRGGGRGQSQGARQNQEAASHPSLPLRLLGIIRVGAVRYASLTDGTELYVAAEGSSVQGGYEIVEVGIDYAEIKWGEQQVRLTLES